MKLTLTKKTKLSNIDKHLILQINNTEKKYDIEMQKIIESLSNFSIIIGQMNEMVDFIKFDNKFTELKKDFNRIEKQYNRKRRKYIKFLENKRIILDSIYKKYNYKDIKKLLK